MKYSAFVKIKMCPPVTIKIPTLNTVIARSGVELALSEGDKLQTATYGYEN